MNTRLITLGVLLVISIILYASEDPSETTGYDQKKQELDQLAQRFKAETGFKGDIERYPEQMRLARFTGNFDDIDMTNVRDSVAFRQVCTNIINKLLPYIEARNEQLVPGKINVDSNQIGTRYYQIVNGYKIDGGGYLNIYYLYDQERFGILNVTADIKQLTSKVNFSEVDPVSIYYEHVEVGEDDKSIDFFRPKFKLRYCNIFQYEFDKPFEYRLCWTGGSSRRLVIDAETGEVYIDVNGMSYD